MVEVAVKTDHSDPVFAQDDKLNVGRPFPHVWWIFCHKAVVREAAAACAAQRAGVVAHFEWEEGGRPAQRGRPLGGNVAGGQPSLPKKSLCCRLEVSTLTSFRRYKLKKKRKKKGGGGKCVWGGEIYFFSEDGRETDSQRWDRKMFWFLANINLNDNATICVRYVQSHTRSILASS